MPRLLIFTVLLSLLTSSAAWSQPVAVTDLANFSPAAGLYQRVLGSDGNGANGVPVAAGFDLDRDGLPDYALAAMTASPDGRVFAGEIYLVFGNHQASGEIDTAEYDPRVLEIWGDQQQETIGSEVWMADLTGDGYGELIICRQNHDPGSRIGAGAVTLIGASQTLRTMAEAGQVLDLRSPPPNIPILNIYGATSYSRLCIWTREGDVTGDGIADLAIGADREASNGDANAGAVYLLRGGDWLNSADDIDLADFGTVAPGNLARFKPRPGSSNFHLGATVFVADLDGNGRGEVLAAAALNRAGAALPPAGGTGSGAGGEVDGTLFIAWDDNFSGDWMPAPDFVIDAGPGSYTLINGAADNEYFGEELLGGLDFDNDGTRDLFVGDLTADGYGSIFRVNAGTAHVIYNAASLKGLEFDLEPDVENEPGPPEGFAMATFVGPIANAIAADTALQGDFNADGIADLAFSSPHDAPAGRENAGTIHIALGKTGKWPALSDLSKDNGNYPDPADVQIYEIWGAKVQDVLCYSAAPGDITGDGRPDIVTNEMKGDGSIKNDVGNLLVIDSLILFNGQTIHRDGFE